MQPFLATETWEKLQDGVNHNEPGLVWEYEEELNDTTKKSQLTGVMFIHVISFDLPCETEFEKALPKEWNRSLVFIFAWMAPMEECSGRAENWLPTHVLYLYAKNKHVQMHACEGKSQPVMAS